MALTPGRAGRIAGVSLTSADAESLAEFYVALGFVRAGVELRDGPAFARLVRLPHAEARVILLTLGQERVELASFAEPGRPYPRDSAADDPWFQHFAIVVSSMEEAYRRLTGCAGWTPITESAPQRLPESSGGVLAFKFRDPEGHPLELLEFPEERIPPMWHARRDEWRIGRDVGELPTDARTLPRHAPTPFLGIDHSAIVVASSSRSIEFYERRLALTRAGGSLNTGVEQARLDGLAQPRVEVTALAASVAPPHLELLCYQAPARREPTGMWAANDVAATKLLIEMAGTGSDDSGASEARGSEPVLIHDPDGHALVLAPGG